MITWMLVVYGITLTVTGSRIAAPLRRLVAHFSRTAGKFVECPMCIGWWVGLIGYCALPQLSPVHEAIPIVSALANAFAASATCWIVHVALTKLGADRL